MIWTAQASFAKSQAGREGKNKTLSHTLSRRGHALSKGSRKQRLTQLQFTQNYNLRGRHFAMPPQGAPEGSVTAVCGASSSGFSFSLDSVCVMPPGLGQAGGREAPALQGKGQPLRRKEGEPMTPVM